MGGVFCFLSVFLKVQAFLLRAGLFRDFLSSKGIKYELVGLHPKTHNMFWVYIKNEELDKYTSEWSQK